VGWDFNYEEVNDVEKPYISMWGTCMTRFDRPIIENNALTENGKFWMTDIAMMTQGLIRTCELHKIKMSDHLPVAL
jgi:hypothetical protein